MGLESCRLIDFPKIADLRGNLTFVEGDRHIPFPIRRVYYLYDVPGGGIRGGHAHKALEQVIIALNGYFDVVMDDGRDKRTVHLSRGDQGLYMAEGVWRELTNFSDGAVCLVLASRPYEEEDYFRQYSHFLAAVHRGEFAR